MGKNKKNYLLEAVVGSFLDSEKGKVLDLGCGDGDYSKRLKDLGFDVLSADLDKKRFRYADEIDFRHCDITKEMPFPDDHFDYVLLLEVVEHLRNPYEVMQEINRVLKKEGKLILSTPNILNLKSRFRFLFEGAYQHFREPPMEQVDNPKEVIFNLHIAPWRYHELEYLLSSCGFNIAGNFTSVYEGYEYSFVLPIIKFQAAQKERRAQKNGKISYERINRIILSKELLFGRHLIVKAQK